MGKNDLRMTLQYLGINLAMGNWQHVIIRLDVSYNWYAYLLDLPILASSSEDGSS